MALAAQAPAKIVNSEGQFHRPCPVCERDEPQPFWSKHDLQIVRCANCSMLYVADVAPEFASGQHYDRSEYHLWPDKLASDYSPVRFERELRIFREFCPIGEVLDVGCSTGAFLVQLQSQFPQEYSGTGLDIAGAPLNYAETRGIRVIREPFLEHDFAGERFDAVTFWAVMEHLPDPRAFLGGTAKILKPGGYCFILVPNMRSLAARLLGPRYRYVLPDHLNYFTAKTLLRFVQIEKRFEVRALRSTHFNPLVILQDLKNRGNPVDATARARLLKKTTAMKQSRLLLGARLLYRACEAVLGHLYLADNLVIVLGVRPTVSADCR